MTELNVCRPRFSAAIKVVSGPNFYNLDCSRTEPGFITDYPLRELATDERYSLKDRWATKEQAYSCNAYNCSMWGLYHENGVILRHFNSVKLHRDGMLAQLRSAITRDVNEMRNFFWPVRGLIAGGQAPSASEPGRESDVRSAELKDIVAETLRKLRVPFSTLWGAEEDEYDVHANTYFDVETQTWHLMFAEHDRRPYVGTGHLKRSLTTRQEIEQHLSQIELLPDDTLYIADQPVLLGPKGIPAAPGG